MTKLFPYERIVQWSAGPASVGAGWLATQLFQNANIGNTITQASGGQITKTTSAAYIAKAIVFVVGALVTYAAHHKWLNNLAYWWKHAEAEAEPDLSDQAQVLTEKPDSAVRPDGPSITTAGTV